MRFITTILLMFVAAGAFGRGVVNVSIQDVSNERPIGATLEVLRNGSVLGSLFVENGYCQFDVDAGTYEMKVSSPGFETVTKTLDVKDDEVRDVVIKLNLKGTVSAALPKGDNILKGTIVSADGSPIEFASVRLLAADSTFVGGGATGKDGRFEIRSDYKGNGRVIVSAMGFAVKTLDADIDSGTDVGTVTLEPEAHSLGEVTVKGRAMTRVDSHLQIIPEKILVKHASTGYQLLRNLMLPGMVVNPLDGTVSLFGQKVSIYINGEPAEYRMVQNLRPRDVEKIEYHDAPIGRYAMDFAAINFITRQQTTGGFVTLDARQSIGGYLDGNYNGFSKINSGRTTYYLFGGYRMHNGAAETVEKTEEFDLLSRSIERTYNSLGGRNRNYGEYGQLTIQNTGDRHHVSVSAGLSGAHSVVTSSGRTVYSEPVSLTQTTASRAANTGLSPRLGYYGNFNVRENNTLITSFNASYSRSTYNYDYRADDDGVMSDTKDHTYNLSAQVAYLMNFKHRNSLMFSLQDNFKVASTDYVGSYGSWQHMWNSEMYFLVEYNHRLSDRLRVSVRPGLLMVNTGLHGYEQQNYYNPMFFSQLTYNPTRSQQLNLRVTVNSTSPSLSDRTAAEQPIDLIMSRRGDPELKNVKNYNFNANYSAQVKRVNLAAYFTARYRSDALTTAYLPEADRLIVTLRNGKYKEFNFTPMVTWNVTDNFRLETGGSLCHFAYDNGLEKQPFNFATGMVSMMYFWRNLSFNLRFNSTSRFFVSSYERTFYPAGMEFSMAWTHGNWRLDGWIYTLERSNRREWIDVAAYRMDKHHHGRLAGMVKVAYTFDFGKKVKRERMEADTSIDSSILK